MQHLQVKKIASTPLKSCSWIFWWKHVTSALFCSLRLAKKQKN